MGGLLLEGGGGDEKKRRWLLCLLGRMTFFGVYATASHG